jgi:hypothetical protein
MKKIKTHLQQNQLKLHRETLRLLTTNELRQVAGGVAAPPNTDRCFGSNTCSDRGICSTSPVIQAL